MHLPSDYMATLQRIATRLRTARRVRGLTQEQLAERAGVHRNTIQNLEADRFTRVPAFRIDVMIAVAHALDIQPAELFA